MTYNMSHITKKRRTTNIKNKNKRIAWVVLKYTNDSCFGWIPSLFPQIIRDLLFFTQYTIFLRRFINEVFQEKVFYMIAGFLKIPYWVLWASRNDIMSTYIGFAFLASLLGKRLFFLKFIMLKYDLKGALMMK